VTRLPHGETLVNRALNDAEPITISQLVNRFGVQDMLTAPREPDFLASLLYYFGVLTLAGYDVLGKLKLTIPNSGDPQALRRAATGTNVAALRRSGTAASGLLKRFYTTGDLGPLCELLEQRYFKVFDNRDLRWSNELVIKTAFIATLV
jgi:hypothetical protein